MDDAAFRDWMKQMAAIEEEARPAGASAIWWRAQVRRRFERQERATRPLRIVENGAAILCWMVAARARPMTVASAVAEVKTSAPSQRTMTVQLASGLESMITAALR